MHMCACRCLYRRRSIKYKLQIFRLLLRCRIPTTPSSKSVLSLRIHRSNDQWQVKDASDGYRYKTIASFWLECSELLLSMFLFLFSCFWLVLVTLWTAQLCSGTLAWHTPCAIYPSIFQLRPRIKPDVFFHTWHRSPQEHDGRVDVIWKLVECGPSMTSSFVTEQLIVKPKDPCKIQEYLCGFLSSHLTSEMLFKPQSYLPLPLLTSCCGFEQLEPGLDSHTSVIAQLQSRASHYSQDRV